MDDIEMHGVSARGIKVYVTPLHHETRFEHLGVCDLGGPGGYYLCADMPEGFSVLAKFPDIDAAREVFGLITAPPTQKEPG